MNKDANTPEPAPITPTVGRVVHFYPNGGMVEPYGYDGQPWKADIVAVHSDRMVNLSAFDPMGSHYALTSVGLVQPGDDVPGEGTSYCIWMPYQVKGKATGSESGEAAAGTERI